MAMLISIYKITNKKNLKCYIGQTNQCVQKRFNQHCNYSKSLINRAIKKHGKENFEITILSVCSSLDESNRQEIEYIKKFRSLYNQHGYNISEGGLNKSSSELTKNKLRRQWFKLSKKEQAIRLNKMLKGITPEIRKSVGKKVANKRVRPMRFVNLETGEIFDLIDPRGFMKKHKLDRSTCHKMAKRKKYTFGRNGIRYKCKTFRYKNFEISYLKQES